MNHRLKVIGCIAAIVCGWSLCPAFAANPQIDGQITLQPPRWRAVRQVIDRCGAESGFRFAMPDTISRRAWTGSTDAAALAVAKVLEDLAGQTGLTMESFPGVLVFHAPKDEQRQRLAAQAAGSDSRRARQAICELGWLADARAWPVLAEQASGSDVPRALAAAQALRRLEGEKPLDWRLFGISSDDPELVPMAEPIANTQVPLGVAFPEAVPGEAIERLAASSYIPLREAAARLAACQRVKGQAIAEKLLVDPSPIVRAAAVRVQSTWAPSNNQRGAERKKPDQKPWWELPAPDLQLAAAELAQNKDHDTVWRLTGRRVAYQGTPAAIQVMLDYGHSGGKWSSHVSRALAEWCGGPDVARYLAHDASAGAETYGHERGWALWGLSALQDGEELARSLRPALEDSRTFWAAPPEFTAARGAGIYALQPLLGRMPTRGHWVCVALGYIGGPDAIDALLAKLDDPDPGIAVAAAKALGDAAALDGVQPLIAQLKHPDRLRRHWAVLGLGRIGGPEAAAALAQLLAEEAKNPDRLVRSAAARLLPEIAPPSAEIARRIAEVEALDRTLVPEYRPRNARFRETFPINTEVAIPEHKPVSYCSVGETRAALDWANRLVFRYGGCTPCYSNECFGFDVGSGTWFPVRPADHYCHLFNEIRPNAGCSRGMTYDGLNKWVWIGQAIGATTGPTGTTHNLANGLGAYDAALDRFIPCANAVTMAKAYSGEPAKYFAFDPDRGLVVASASGGQGIGVLDVHTRRTQLLEAPAEMPSCDQYRPPAFAYDPIAQRLLCTHPDLKWKLLTYDFAKNEFNVSQSAYPGEPEKHCQGGLVYDSLNREMILIGGISRETKRTMPTCRYDRDAGVWVDLNASDIGLMGLGQGTCVFDPEHNVILEIISGAAYRFAAKPVGTRAFYGGGIGQP